MKNKVQNKRTLGQKKKKTKHAKYAAVILLAIRILKNLIIYSRLSLRFKEV